MSPSIKMWSYFGMDSDKKSEKSMLKSLLLNKVAAHRSGWDWPGSNVFSLKLEKETSDSCLLLYFFLKNIMASPPPRPVVLGDLKYVQSGGKRSEKKLDLPTFSPSFSHKWEIQNMRREEAIYSGGLTQGGLDIWGAQRSGWKLLWLTATDASQVSAGYSRKHSGDEPVHI